MNSKLDSVIDTLLANRKQLCAFHTTKLFSFGKTSSQLSECQNSQIKGGNSYARWIRAQTYVETLVHIATLMNLYVDDTIGRILKCVDEKKVVSPWIQAKLETSLRKLHRCLFPAPRLHDTQGGDDGVEIWLLFEAVPVKGCLPAFQQKHSIRFKLGQPAPCTCSCPYFTSTRLPCCAMCAVFSSKNIQTIEAISHHMDEMWLIRCHPIYPVAMSLAASGASGVAVALPPVTSQNMIAVSETIARSNADAMRSVQLPTDVSSRRMVLSNLFAQVLSRTAACSTSSRDMHAYLVQHRSKLAQSQSLFVPPASEISVYQAAVGMGPASEVLNRANITYNPAKKGRVRIARSSDPSKYSTHKQAGYNQPVECLCGIKYTNEKKVRLTMHYITCVQSFYRLHLITANQRNMWLGSRNILRGRLPPKPNRLLLLILIVLLVFVLLLLLLVILQICQKQKKRSIRYTGQMMITLQTHNRYTSKRLLAQGLFNIWPPYRLQNVFANRCRLPLPPWNHRVRLPHRLKTTLKPTTSSIWLNNHYPTTADLRTQSECVTSTAFKCWIGAMSPSMVD